MLQSPSADQQAGYDHVVEEICRGGPLHRLGAGQGKGMDACGGSCGIGEEQENLVSMAGDRT